MGRRWHRLELGNGVNDFKGFVPLEVLEGGLGLCSRHCLEADCTAFTLKDLERWSVEYHLLVKISRLTSAILVIE